MSSHSHDGFAAKRWSVVTLRADTVSTDAHAALTELVWRYGYAVYAYVRRCGHAPGIAEDIMRTFLRHLVARFPSTNATRAHGNFRRYLLDELQTFLAGDWRESIEESGVGPESPPDLEWRYQRDNADAPSPETAYQRSFAREVLVRALRRLRAEAEQTGHADMFEQLHPFLTQDPAADEYEAMAKRLAMRPLALDVALKRLRQRLRELVGSELSDTVTTADGLAVEQAALLDVLRGAATP